MTPIEIITLTVGISLLIALFLHKKALNEDYNFYLLTGEHLYDPQGLEERGKILLWVAKGNLILALLNLFLYIFQANACITKKSCIFAKSHKLNFFLCQHRHL